MADTSLGPKNPQLSLEYFTAAAEQGHIGSAAYLGRVYAEGLSVDQSTHRAILLYRLAADGGHQAAMYNVGLLSSQGGADSPPDLILGLEYFLKAYWAGVDSGRKSSSLSEAARTAHGVISDTIAQTYSLNMENLDRIFQSGSKYIQAITKHVF